MYTALQPRQFSSDTTKVVFAALYLRGVAFNWFEPYFNLDGIDRPTWLDNFQEFSAKLQDTFGDPGRSQTAAKKIHDLKQTKSVGEYWANFQRYAVQTGFNDAAKCFAFRNGLKDSVKGALALVEEPKNCNLLAELSIRLDSRIHEREQESCRGMNTERKDQRPPTKAPPSHAYQSTPRTSITKSETTHKVRVANPRSTTSSVCPRGRLPPEEYQRRRDNNLCLYCGQAGHLIGACPSAPKQDARGKPQLRVANTYGDTPKTNSSSLVVKH